MNTSILKKCLDELNKENPRKDYVIGMIETLIDTQGSNQTRDIPIYPGLGATAINVPYIIPEREIAPLSDEEKRIAAMYNSGPVAAIS